MGAARQVSKDEAERIRTLWQTTKLSGKQIADIVGRSDSAVMRVVNRSRICDQVEDGRREPGRRKAPERPQGLVTTPVVPPKSVEASLPARQDWNLGTPTQPRNALSAPQGHAKESVEDIAFTARQE